MSQVGKLGGQVRSYDFFVIRMPRVIFGTKKTGHSLLNCAINIMDLKIVWQLPDSHCSVKGNLRRIKLNCLCNFFFAFPIGELRMFYIKLSKKPTTNNLIGRSSYIKLPVGCFSAGSSYAFKVYTHKLYNYIILLCCYSNKKVKKESQHILQPKFHHQSFLIDIFVLFVDIL